MDFLLKKIEALFSNETAPAEQAVNFQDAKLQDGTTIRITDSLVQGAKVEVINEDATLSVPAAGELTLEDGTKITVDENGLITEITPADNQEETEEKPEEMASSEKAPETISKDEFTALTAKVDELYRAVEMIVSALEGKNAEMSAVKSENTELKSKNEELSKVASAPAVNFKKYESTITVKVDGAKPKNDMLSRVLKRKESK